MLSNVIVVSVGAIIVYCITLCSNNAKVSRLLWMTLLLKLLTPPLYQLPVLPAPEIATTRTHDNPGPITSPPVVIGGEALIQLRQILHEPEIQPNTEKAPKKAGILTFAHMWMTTIYNKLPLMYLWLAGSALWCIINGWQIFHLRKLLKAAAPVPDEIAEDAITISDKIGLRREPKLVLVDAMMSPCVWAWKRTPYILISRELFARMDRHQRQTILTHEMAHLRQGDHWLRWFELLVIAVYWWFPVAWWIVKQLHKSGEYCCDSHVYDVHPNKRRAYARALVETVECLAGTNSKIAVLGVRNLSGPMLLQRRIKLISELKGKKMKMDWKTKLLTMLIAGSTLMLSVGYAGDKDAKDAHREKSAKDVSEALDMTELTDLQKRAVKKAVQEALSVRAARGRRHNDDKKATRRDVSVHTHCEGVIIGPDGKKQEFKIGDGKMDLAKLLGKMDLAKLLNSQGGQPIHVTTRAFKIGDDGKVEEIQSDELSEVCEIATEGIPTDVKVECSTTVSGKVVMIGPDGKKQEFDLGGGEDISQPIKIDNGKVTITTSFSEDDAKATCKIDMAEGQDSGKAGNDRAIVIGKNGSITLPEITVDVDDEGKLIIVMPDGTKQEIEYPKINANEKTHIVSVSPLKAKELREEESEVLRKQIEALEKQIRDLTRQLEALKKAAK